jgi:hypothetical protein
MRTVLAFAAALALAALAWGAGPATPPARKKAPARKPRIISPAKKAPTKAAAVKKPAAARKPPAGTATASARRGKKAPVPRTTWRNRQTAPSPDRYKEIQDALVARGYLPSEEATGAWGESSAGALKKFQAEQTLESTGKINSLSLIALGLGPKHDSLPVAPSEGNAGPPEASGRNY